MVPPPTLPSRTDRGFWLLAAAYVVIFGGLLVATHGYPYVFDNNESYSSLWHARSLYANGIAHTKGLTDEVFARHTAASPYVHTHQGNLPRLFSFALYALGLRSMAGQLWVAVFTVGFAGFYLAYRFLRQLAGPLFALLAGLAWMTDYLLFVEYHASLYHVWHLFFLFSSLLCVHGWGGARPRRWLLVSVLNFAGLFYWEIVFTSFVAVLCALYAVARHGRRWRVWLRGWAAIAAGAALAWGLLLAQLTAYMGWANVREDIHLTLTARNAASNAALLRQIADFYRAHHIIFWYNFQDTAGLRSVRGFFTAFFHGQLTYVTPELAAAMLILAAGWLLGMPRGNGFVRPRRLKAGAFGRLAGAGLRYLLAGLAAGLIVTAAWAAFQPRLPAASPVLWAAAAGGVFLLGRAWTGGWWGWRRLRVPRLLLAVGYAAAVRWFLAAQGALYDQAFRGLWTDVTGDDGTGWIPALLVLGAAATGLTLIVLGNRAVLGRGPDAAGRRLLPWLLCSLAAYAAVYAAFTGYVYSGYLVRHVPFFVFLSDPLLAAGAWVLALMAVRGLARVRRTPGALGRRLAALAAALLLLLGAGFWLRLQARYVALAPPDSYAFLRRLRRPPFRGHSVVTNTYPAPLAWEAGSWGYADPSALTGTVTLTPRGFETEHDLKYLWFADRDTNPAYLRPDFGVSVLQPVNLTEALQHVLERRAARDDDRPWPPPAGLTRRAQEGLQPFLQDSLVAAGANFSAVRFDWDYPPYLLPVDRALLAAAGTLTLRQRLAISATGQALWRRWRIELAPLAAEGGDPAAPELDLLAATVDDQPVFTGEAMTAAGWTPLGDAAGKPGRTWNGAGGRAISAVAMGNEVRLVLRETPRSGRLRVTVNAGTQVVDLHAAQPGERTIALSTARPFGRLTSVPSFPAGLYVRTTLHRDDAGGSAEIEYRYQQQDGRPEEATTLRIYHEAAPDRWEVADTLTYLGSRGIPVRLAEFRRLNPDTVREHARVAAAGDRRSYEEWLADYLADTPAAWHRPGVVAAAALPPPAEATGVTRRRVPLPAGLAGRLQISVTPATWTKTGPEYFSLLFPADRAASLPPGGTQRLVIEPPHVDEAAALPYGRLRLRVRFPTNRLSQAEPIVATGVEEAGDFVYVIYADPHHIRLGFDHWFRGGPLTDPLPVDYGAVHTLEISMGSLYPPADDFAFAGMTPEQVRAMKDTVQVVLDGRTVIDAAGDCFESPQQQVTVGRNTIRGTTSNPRFTGEILSCERVWPGQP